MGKKLGTNLPKGKYIILFYQITFLDAGPNNFPIAIPLSYEWCASQTTDNLQAQHEIL